MHVWDAISQNWKSPLVFLRGTGKKGVTAKDYQEQVLEPVVSPAFLGLYDYMNSPDSQYIEDQASIHGTHRALVEVKSDLGIPLHCQLAASPDLNSIEDV